MKREPSKTNGMELTITDKKMLQLRDVLKRDDKIRFYQEFYDAAEIPKQSIRNIKLGKQHFTAVHITNICVEFGVNANWIHGIDKKNIYRF